MDFTQFKNKLTSQFENKSSVPEIYEELEASYQQLLAMSEQLEQSENRYSLLIQNMNDIVWISDSVGTILYINHYVTDLLGYERDEMIGRPLYAFMCPLHNYKSGPCKNVVNLMSKQDFDHEELWMLHKDGNTRKVLEVNSKRVFYNGQTVEIQGVGRDVTERIQIQRKINKRNKQMDFINELSMAITTNLSLNDLDGLLNDICKNIVNVMHVPLCTIRLIEENELHLKSVCGRIRHLVNTSPMPIIGWESEIAFRTGEPVVTHLDTLTKDHLHFNSILRENKIETVTTIPLIANEKPLGVLIISTDESYDQDYVMTLSSIANNIAFAIEKSNLYRDLKQFYVKIIATLVAAIEAKDTYTQGHSLRVSQYALKISKQMGLDKDALEEIEIAGLLHDVGKIGISDSILTKPGQLTKDEYEIIKNHPLIGAKILEPIGLSDNIMCAVKQHHLRFDLTGYPVTPELDQITIYARIIGVADALDAMTSNRSYKSMISKQQAIDELLTCSGSQFCPEVVQAAVEYLVKGRS
jgi:PAS domain S-box-containing protein/putative nucleotidyltransferase with HDIG domain